MLCAASCGAVLLPAFTILSAILSAVSQELWLLLRAPSCVGSAAACLCLRTAFAWQPPTCLSVLVQTTAKQVLSASARHALPSRPSLLRHAGLAYH